MRFELSCISSRPIAPLTLRRLVSFKEEAGALSFPRAFSAIAAASWISIAFSAPPTSFFPTLPNNTCMRCRIRALSILLETPTSNCNRGNCRGCFHKRSTSSAVVEQVQAYALDDPSDVDPLVNGSRWSHKVTSADLGDQFTNCDASSRRKILGVARVCASALLIPIFDSL
jgi:hypothetical protein